MKNLLKNVFFCLHRKNLIKEKKLNCHILQRTESRMCDMDAPNCIKL